MGFAVASQPYCCVCGTEHLAPADCPGELRATGAERPAWRVNVETPFGHEAIGVLLAPSHDRWRARIITYPNVLWAIPGGRGTLKFVGDSPHAAEQQAIAFVERHVQAKRYLRRDGLAPAGVGLTSNPAAQATRSVYSTERRKLRCLPVRFGTDRAITRAMTVNLSTEGMFIGVLNPEGEGQFLLIHLQLEGQTLPLRGMVMWNRRRSEPERPAGMGIRLSDPPVIYQTFVDGLP